MANDSDTLYHLDQSDEISVPEETQAQTMDSFELIEEYEDQVLIEAEDGSIYVSAQQLEHGEEVGVSMHGEDWAEIVGETVNVVEEEEQHGNGKKKKRPEDESKLPFTYAGQTFSLQAQKLILNAYSFFKRHKSDPYVLERLGSPLEQAGKILNVSSSVIAKIRKKYEKTGRVGMAGNRKTLMKKTLGDNTLGKVDEEKEEEIRHIVKEFQESGTPLTVPAIMKEASRRIAYKGSRSSFRRLLCRMGYKYSKEGKVSNLNIDPGSSAT